MLGTEGAALLSWQITALPQKVRDSKYEAVRCSDHYARGPGPIWGYECHHTVLSR